jgi:hypothetical protein
MSGRPFVILDAGRPLETVARIAGDAVRLTPPALRDALGWEVHAGQLCRESLCVPVPEGLKLEHDDGLDLAALATVLGRALALDLEERAAYLGASAAERRRALASLQAPDFTLPDLAGRPHALSQHRGRKVFLVAWASW